jgi:hypothetical protein
VDPNTRAAEERLRLALGTRVHIVRKDKPDHAVIQQRRRIAATEDN